MRFSNSDTDRRALEREGKISEEKEGENIVRERERERENIGRERERNESVNCSVTSCVNL